MVLDKVLRFKMPLDRFTWACQMICWSGDSYFKKKQKFNQASLKKKFSVYGDLTTIDQRIVLDDDLRLLIHLDGFKSV